MQQSHGIINIALILAVVVVATVADVNAANSTSSLCLSGAVPLVLSTTCAPGWYCPLYNSSDESTYPVMCAPTNECLMDRISAKFCSPQGTYEPQLCPEGFYCPTPQTMIECPTHSYCPRGQYEPISCGVMTTCKSGSSKKMEYSSIIAMIIIDTCIIIIWFSVMKWKRNQLSTRDVTYRDSPLTSVNPQLNSKGGMYEQLPSHSKSLCHGFKRAQHNLPSMLIQFDNLSLTIPATKQGHKDLTILKGVTGSIEPAKVTAIMGPSGAGKTTFLNTMLGKVDSSWKRGGSLRINGEEEQLGRFRKVIGYVPQEDIMHRDLSVYDNIRYSANIRLPSDWNAKQREDHVNATIAAMQIKEVQDSRVGDEVIRGVSGGQRKRCNIGMEIAAAPSLLLLDEPTSGLDSTAAMEICQVLKDLARVSSLTVAMVIHQPRIEIWNQLDELLLLAPGGLTVYQGPQRVAVQYFVDRFDIHIAINDNPADALMDHIAKQADEFVRGWLQGGKEHVEVLKKKHQQHKQKRSITAGNGTTANNSTTDKKEENDDHDDVDDAPTILLQPIVPSSSSTSTTIAASSMPVPLANESRVIHVASTTPRANGNGHASLDPQVAIAVASNGHNGYGSSASLVPAAFPKVTLRSTSNFVIQVKLAFVRNLWKQTANLPSLALEVGLAMFAGCMMGAMVILKYQGVLLAPYTLLSPTPLEGLIGQVFFNVGLAISLASASAGVSVFGEEQVIYRREVAAGHHHSAYYIGVSLAQLPRLFLCGSHFAFIFHIMAQPLTSFGHWLLIVCFLYTAIYGLAAIVSMLVSRKNAALLGVVVSLFTASMTGKGGMPEAIQYLSASRWATEGMFSFETQPYRHIMDVTRSAHDGGYQLDRFGLDIFIMFGISIFYRLIAYIAMRWVDRKLLV